jgi:hypothetical protein
MGAETDTLLAAAENQYLFPEKVFPKAVSAFLIGQIKGAHQSPAAGIGDEVGKGLGQFFDLR